MIDPEKRKAIYQMHLAGMPLRQISRQFQLSRNTVRAIVTQQGALPQTVRSDKIHIDRELLERLYRECDGWIQRLHEKLTEDEGIAIGYPTLTRMVREMGLSRPRAVRCDQVPDEPGAEMQHDTTVYRVTLAGRPTRVIASLLYLRYSKRRYLRFYTTFDRFAMKCFLHEALMYWGYAPRQCVIDNTNLARWRGSGKSAVIVPEMVRFSQQYGFTFLCHAIRHPNRKAGEERSFWTVETNFLPGRTFESLEDLNQQARQWSTERMEHRAAAKTGLIPAKAFEHEMHSLRRLPAELPAPYRMHPRDTDQYGYMPLHGNYYWVPGTDRHAVKALEYADRVQLYLRRECVAEYALPAHGVKNKHIWPEGMPQPRPCPRPRRRESHLEEQRLRQIDPVVSRYLDYALQTPGLQRHRYVRELWALSRRVTTRAFVQTLERALRYRVTQLQTLQRIAWLCTSQGEATLPTAEVDTSYQQREAYQTGSMTEQPDLSIYDDAMTDKYSSSPADPSTSSPADPSTGEVNHA